MDETTLVLDGNALAGPLAEIFAHEMTVALARCAGCGALDVLGAAMVYGGPRAPGAVVRCRSCTAVLGVLVQREDRWRLSLGGVRWLEIPSA